jgi:DNA-binding response OmpR family regulator
MRKSFDIIVFSVDIVFSNIMRRIFENYANQYHTEYLESFSEAHNIPAMNPTKLVVVNDVILGSSSFELISFLRLDRKLNCPIYHFDAADYQNERKSLLIGTSLFFRKPFNLDEVVSIIKKTL